MSITTRSELSPNALSGYLVKLPVAQVVHHIEFALRSHQDRDDDRWRVIYEADTIVGELDLRFRKKTYMAAAVGDRALAFVRPPIFDDVFIEEITDLYKIWSGKRKTFSNEKARRFFETYKGQPVLDKAMQAVAKLKGQARLTPRQQVQEACQGFISEPSADLLGRGMLSLLDKVSPPHSLWSWGLVMLVPIVLMALGAQNWFENQAPSGHWGLFFAWLGAAITALALTLCVSPIAAAVSAVVSAVRRHAIPAEYRQHGRNWQPLRAVLLTAVAVTSLGAALGLMTHENLAPRWNNTPVAWMEDALRLQGYEPYVAAAASLKQAGLFVTSPSTADLIPARDPVLTAMQQNLRLLGYRVMVSGRLDELTEKAIASFAKRRKVRVDMTKPEEALAMVCTALKDKCVKAVAPP